MTAPTPGWDEFAAGLRKTLGRMGDGILLVLNRRDQPWQYAQFAEYPDELVAEVSGETVPDEGVEDRPTPEGQRLLEAGGWRPPVYEKGYRWHRFIEYPPTSAEYRELVEAVVVALRDVNGVPGPDHLTYRAWDSKDDNRPWRVEIPGVAADPQG